MANSIGTLCTVSAAISIALVLDVVGNSQNHSTTAKAIPTEDDAEHFLGGLELLAVGDTLTLAQEPSGSGHRLQLSGRVVAVLLGSEMVLGIDDRRTPSLDLGSMTFVPNGSVDDAAKQLATQTRNR